MSSNIPDEKIRREGRRADTKCPWCKSEDTIIKDGVFSCSRCSYEKDVSGPHEIKVVGWTTNDNRDYVYHRCTDEIRDAIVREVREKGYDFSWNIQQFSSMPCTPVINNGFMIDCGKSTWCSIMAEAHGEILGNGSIYDSYDCDLMLEIANSVPKNHVDHTQLIPFEIKN